MKEFKHDIVIDWFNEVEFNNWVEVPRDWCHIKTKLLRAICTAGYGYITNLAYVYKLSDIDRMTSVDIYNLENYEPDKYRLDFIKTVSKNPVVFKHLNTFELVHVFIANNSKFTLDDIYKFIVNNKKCSKGTVRYYLSNLVKVGLLDCFSGRYSILDKDIIEAYFTDRLAELAKGSRLNRDTDVYRDLVRFNDEPLEFDYSYMGNELRTKLQQQGYMIMIEDTAIKVKNHDLTSSVYGYNGNIFNNDDRNKLIQKLANKRGFSFNLISKFTARQTVYYLLGTNGFIQNEYQVSNICGASGRSVKQLLNSLIEDRVLTMNGGVYVECKEEPRQIKDIYEIANRIKQLKEKKNGKN